MEMRPAVPDVPRSCLLKLWNLTWGKPNSYPFTTLSYEGQTYEFMERTIPLKLLFPHILPRYILVRDDWKLAYEQIPSPDRDTVVRDNYAILGGSGIGE